MQTHSAHLYRNIGLMRCIDGVLLSAVFVGTSGFDLPKGGCLTPWVPRWRNGMDFCCRARANCAVPKAYIGCRPSTVG
jgi:hypothetical protein